VIPPPDPPGGESSQTPTSRPTYTLIPRPPAPTPMKTHVPGDPSYGSGVPLSAVPQIEQMRNPTSTLFANPLDNQTVTDIIDRANFIANWPKKWSIKFNPPLARSASGVEMGVWGRDSKGNMTDLSSATPDTRDVTMGDANLTTRLHRKGYVIPDITYSEDWAATAEGNDVTVESELPNSKSLLVLNGKPTIYGFKFLYNPATLDFSVGAYPGVNISYLYSGKNTAMPTGVQGTGSTISMSFPLTRIDDMQFIHGPGRVIRVYDGSDLRKIKSPNYTIDGDVNDVYGKTGEFSVTNEDIQGIGSRGTMYDLEFLFRATLGRAWNTQYRAKTADVGILFSMPMVLVLSETMVYRVRISSVQFTHRSFTPDMVPLYTDVALGFERIPDVTRLG